MRSRLGNHSFREQQQHGPVSSTPRRPAVMRCGRSWHTDTDTLKITTSSASSRSFSSSERRPHEPSVGCRHRRRYRRHRRRYRRNRLMIRGPSTRPPHAQLALVLQSPLTRPARVWKNTPAETCGEEVWRKSEVVRCRKGCTAVVSGRRKALPTAAWATRMSESSASGPGDIDTPSRGPIIHVHHHRGCCCPDGSTRVMLSRPACGKWEARGVENDAEDEASASFSWWSGGCFCVVGNGLVEGTYRGGCLGQLL